MDSVPIVAITGQVPTTAVGNDAFQEAYTTGITMPATKHNYFVTDPNDIPDVVHEAFHIAATGRPGPVLIDLPKDILNAQMTWHSPATELDLPGYRPTVEGHPRRVKEAVELMANARRPVLYVGGGVIKAGGSEALLELANRTGIPVTTTLMGRGCFPDSHPLALGMPGMHGTYAAITAIQKSEVPIVGDAKRVLEQLVEAWGARVQPDRSEWINQIKSWQRDHPLSYDQQPDGPIKQQYVIEEIHRITGGDAIVVAGVGQHQMWTSQFWKFDDPRRWINSGGLGTMGFAVPAAIGAAVGKPDELVYAIDGDGCFQMTSQELITAAEEGIPVKIAVMNNSVYGMVTQWQKLFYNERYSASQLGSKVDYVMLAEAMGCAGLRATTPEEVAPTIEKSLAIDDRPVVVEFVVDPEEMVFPMVPSGGSNDEVIVAPGQTVVAP